MISATVGSSSTSPTTWPVGSTPASSRPSTSAAFVSIGALPAIATCAQVRPWFFFIAKPSRARSSSERPLSFRNRSAFAIERGSAVTRPAPSRWSTSSVRITRCG